MTHLCRHLITSARTGLSMASIALAGLLAACGGGDDTPASVAETQATADDHDADRAKALSARHRRPDAESRARALLAQMTQDEKLLLVHGAGFPPFFGGSDSGRIPGIPRLGIPSIRYKDSASGVGTSGIGASAFPSTLGLAASWDTQTMRRVARRIAVEARTLGYAGVLGGGLNLAREPRNGRTFEYLGEDPVLAGELMVARTEATQALGVISTLKHYAGNGQETNRFASNSVIAERPLRELYLRGFEMATVRAQPGNVMCAYNLVNGDKSCESRELLTDILKDEWGFQGVVQSDWFAAVTDTVKAANAGLDEEQPGSADDCTSLPPFLPCSSFFGTRLKAAIELGAVPQSRLDDMVLRKLRTLYRLGLMDNPPAAAPGTIDSAAADGIAFESAARSIVLMKNSRAAGDAAPVLPLKAAQLRRVVLIGGHADAAVLGGGGSAQAPHRDGNDPPAVDCLTPGAVDPVLRTFSLCATWHRSSPLQALRASLPGVEVFYVDGNDTSSARAAAAASDVAIVVGTQYLVEAVDQKNLALPDNTADPANQSYDQNALIEAVAAVAPRTVVLLQTGTAVTMPWLERVHAVVQAWYPGIRGGEAIAAVLSGQVNPSGKLPLSFPRQEADLPQREISQTDLNVVYAEGMKMGYRWYDAQGIEPLFPFGHGLSYTRFAYGHARAWREANGDVTLRFSLTNAGRTTGSEVAQVYASLPAAADDVPQRLVGFERLTLHPGETRQVSITLPASRFAVWRGGWHVSAGTATLRVGGSSRDAAAAATTLRMRAQRVDHAR